MASTLSTMLELGTAAPSFDLPNTNPLLSDKRVTLEQYASAPALLVAFVCNHCPYVIHIRAAFAEFAAEYADRGLQVVAISANDVSSHPQDGPEMMAEEARLHGFVYPYCFDESQQVAKAYQAACTPDYFLFDGKRKLVYRGQFDASRPGNDEPINGADLRAAADAVLAGQAVDEKQIASMGCNIKWKAGQEPEYY